MADPGSNFLDAYFHVQNMRAQAQRSSIQQQQFQAEQAFRYQQAARQAAQEQQENEYKKGVLQHYSMEDTNNKQRFAAEQSEKFAKAVATGELRPVEAQQQDDPGAPGGNANPGAGMLVHNGQGYRFTTPEEQIKDYADKELGKKKADTAAKLAGVQDALSAFHDHMTKNYSDTYDPKSETAMRADAVLFGEGMGGSGAGKALGDMFGPPKDSNHVDTPGEIFGKTQDAVNGHVLDTLKKNPDAIHDPDVMRRVQALGKAMKDYQTAGAQVHVADANTNRSRISDQYKALAAEVGDSRQMDPKAWAQKVSQLQTKYDPDVVKIYTENQRQMDPRVGKTDIFGIGSLTAAPSTTPPPE